MLLRLDSALALSMLVEICGIPRFIGLLAGLMGDIRVLIVESTGNVFEVCLRSTVVSGEIVFCIKGGGLCLFESSIAPKPRVVPVTVFFFSLNIFENPFDASKVLFPFLPI